MKKIIKMLSLFLIMVSVLCLTSCVPSKEDAKDKMLEKGYRTIDPSYLVSKVNENVTKMYLFVKADSPQEAIANLGNPKQEKVIVYYFDTVENCKAFHDDYELEQKHLLDSAKEQYEQGKIKEEEYNQTVESFKNLKMGSSKNCFYIGSKEAVKDFK